MRNKLIHSDKIIFLLLSTGETSAYVVTVVLGFLHFQKNKKSKSTFIQLKPLTNNSHDEIILLLKNHDL